MKRKLDRTKLADHGQLQGFIDAFGTRQLAAYFEYLEGLRASGATNMFGASPYLERSFNLDRNKALEILGAWMAAYGDVFEEPV